MYILLGIVLQQGTWLFSLDNQGWILSKKSLHMVANHQVVLHFLHFQILTDGQVQHLVSLALL